MKGCWILNYFKQTVAATSFKPQMLWNSLGHFSKALFEDNTITTNFLKSHVYNTFRIENNTLLATFNNKELGNVKIRP